MKSDKNLCIQNHKIHQKCILFVVSQLCCSFIFLSFWPCLLICMSIRLYLTPHVPFQTCWRIRMPRGKAQTRCWTHQSFCTDEKTWFSRIVQITWFVDLCRNVGLQMAAEGVELASLSLVFSTHEMQEIICQRFYLYEIIQLIKTASNWKFTKFAKNALTSGTRCNRRVLNS